MVNIKQLLNLKTGNMRFLHAFVFIVIFLSGASVQAQGNELLSFYIPAKLYISNEDISFSAHLSGSETSDKRFLNVLLVNEMGDIADSYLFLMKNDTITDHLTLKKGHPTGFYRLIAFTKNAETGKTDYFSKNLFILNQEDERTTYSQIFNGELNVEIQPEGGNALHQQENKFKVMINMPHRVERIFMVGLSGKIIKNIDNYEKGSTIFTSSDARSALKIVSRDTTYSIQLHPFFSSGLKLTVIHESRDSVRIGLAGSKITSREVGLLIKASGKVIDQEKIKLDSSAFYIERAFAKGDFPEGVVSLQLRSSGYKASTIAIENKRKTDPLVNITFAKADFSIRQNNSAIIKLRPDLSEDDIKYYGITIHHEGLMNSGAFSTSNSNKIDSVTLSILKSITEFNTKFKGRAYYVSDSMPVQNNKISFYFLLNGNIQSLETDEDGYFSENADVFYGNSQVFIVGKREKSSIEEVYIEANESHENISFPRHTISSFYFTKEAYEQLKRNQLIKNSYFEEKKNPVNYFTTKKDRKILLNDYHKLPNISEVIRELIANTFVKKVSGEDEIQMRAGDLTKFSGSPLFIVNGIPWLESKDILALPVEAVRSITSINDGPTKYAFGHLGENGILVIDLYDNYEFKPEREVKFTKIQGLNNSEKATMIDCSRFNSSPDINQVISNTFISKLKPVEFCTNDLKGKFKVRVQMITTRGEILEENAYFTVAD